MDGDGHKYYPHGLSSPNAHTSKIPHLIAYQFLLANNKKGKYPEFCMGHNDETGMWVVVGTSITPDLWSSNVRI